MDEDVSSSDGKASQQKAQKKHKSVTKNELSPKLTEEKDIKTNGSPENIIRKILWQIVDKSITKRTSPIKQ